MLQNKVAELGTLSQLLSSSQSLLLFAVIPMACPTEKAFHKLEFTFNSRIASNSCGLVLFLVSL
jgi:hypothetical protein